MIFFVFYLYINSWKIALIYKPGWSHFSWNFIANVVYEIDLISGKLFALDVGTHCPCNAAGDASSTRNKSNSTRVFHGRWIKNDSLLFYRILYFTTDLLLSPVYYASCCYFFFFFLAVILKRIPRADGARRGELNWVVESEIKTDGPLGHCASGYRQL